MNRNKVLVTGGAGYIGSHVALQLKREGYEVIILDNLVNGNKYIVERVLNVELIIGDIRNRLLLDWIFANHNITAVMHFAAFAYVGESISKPIEYYSNNVMGTLTLLEAMLAAKIKNLIFSSTCATYGIPQQIPITEDHIQEPINPYGTTKLAVEKMIEDFDLAYGLKSIIFRYFNAAGADASGLLGEAHDPEPHLIPLVLLTALGKNKSINIFGNDYPTRDGTCIRDYIHVSDIARVHTLGLKFLLKQKKSDIFNLGNGNGFSVKEIIKMSEEITGQTICTIDYPRRAGDPPILIGSNQKASIELGWQPQYTNLEQIIDHAWQWHIKHNSSMLNVKDA